MNRIFPLFRHLVLGLLLLSPRPAGAAMVDAIYNAASDVAVTATNYSATGNSLNLTLNFAPPAGSSLTVVKATGLSFIEGRFDNLAHGQRVELAHNGIRYSFVANYFGGSGNDLVLEWANVRAVGWGDNSYGQLGLGHLQTTRIPTPIATTGALAGKTLLRLAAGSDHTVALCSDGSLFAWGNNSNGRLGNNSEVASDLPVAVDRSGVLAGKTVVSIAAGQGFTIALCSDSTLAFWGRNLSGAAGNGSFNDSWVPTAVTRTGVLAGKSVVSIATGSHYCMALCSDGTLAAWGSNGDGQLGDGTNTNRNAPVAVAQTGALSGKSVVAIAAGAFHCYALCSDGSLAAWGGNNSGQLGNNSITSSLIPVAVVRTGVLSGKTITDISAGGFHGLALCSDSTLATWGQNDSGQLGNSSTTTSRVPVAVVRTGVLSGKSIAAATSGYSHAFALCTDGTCASWGLNSSGQLGDDTTTNRTAPVLVKSTALRAGERFNSLTPGGSAQHGLALAASPPPALLTTQAASAIGDQRATLHGTANANGTTTSLAFEYGTTPALGQSIVAIPASVSGNTDTSASANPAGLLPGTIYRYRIVATGSGGTVAGETLSFTTSTTAALSLLTTPAGSLTPPFQTPLTNYSITVSADTTGISFTPTVATAGATVTVGGIATASGSASAAVPLVAGNNPIPVSVTSADGTVSFTYTIHVTRLPATFTFDTPADVGATATSFNLAGTQAAIALGHAPKPGAVLTLLRTTDLDFIQGSFSNLSQGQLVTLTHAGISYPYVADYFGGSGNDLVLRWANSRPVGWGQNTSGELGFETPLQASSALPVNTSGELAGKTVIATKAANNFSFALDRDGQLYSWGFNQYGQLGTGDTTTTPVPRKVLTTGALAGKRVIAVSAGFYHTLALCSDGTLAAWGINQQGQLGNGSAQDSPVPVAVDRTGVLAGKKVVQIASAGDFNVVLCSDGTLASWGQNTRGQLGNGNLIRQTLPVAVVRDGYLAGRAVAQISAGPNHMLALLADGTLAGWGYNDGGHLGDGTLSLRKTPVAAGIGGALTGKTVVAVSAGLSHSLALCSDGTVAAWGYNLSGEVGNGPTGAFVTVPLAVVRSGVLATRTVTGIGAGPYISLASCSDGTMAAWGANGRGGLGNGSLVDSTVPVLQNPATAYPGSGFQTVRSENVSSHMVALLAFPPVPGAETLAATAIKDLGATLNGEVRASGNTTAVSFEYGLTSSYGTVVAASPASVTGSAATPVQAAVGGLLGGTTYHYRVIAKGPGGEVRGDDSTFTTTTFAALAELNIAGQTLAPAFTQDIAAYAVMVPNSSTSVTVDARAALSSSTVTIQGLPATAGGNTVALTEGANVILVTVTAADGINARTYTVTVTRLPQTIRLTSASQPPLAVDQLSPAGQTLGLELLFPPITGSHLRVINLAGTAPIDGVFDNLAHGQRVTLTFGGIDYPYVANYYGGDGNDLVLHWANSRMFGWGSNINGALGIAPIDNVLLATPADPSARMAGKTILSLVAGRAHTLALLSDGSVIGLGANNNGQLGTNSVTNQSAVPVDTDRSGALAGKAITAIAAGDNHSLTLCSDGTVFAWGSNESGQLGNGSTTQSKIPVAVDRSGVLAGKRVISIAAGSSHSLVLCSDGTVAAWGLNTYGQLGNGLTTSSSLPVLVNRSGVLAGKTVTKLAGGGFHSLALCSDGTLFTWGRNNNGQLGNGTTTDSLVPVAVTASGVLAGKVPADISAGGVFNLTLCQDGTLVAWGYNLYGHLGNGNTTQSAVPVAVTKTGGLAGKTVAGIATGTSHSLAVSTDGTAAAWGQGTGGQRGDGTTTLTQSSAIAVLATNLRSGERFTMLAACPASGISLALVASPPAATVLTLAASQVTGIAATLNASVRPNGGTNTVRFDYGLTSAYGSTFAATPATVSGTSEVAVTASVSSLLPGFTYHYRVVADGPGGTTYGEDRTFVANTSGTLSSLSLSHGVLGPAFDLTRTGYVATVAADVSSLTVTPVTTHPAATARVAGIVTASGTASSPLALTPGNNLIPIEVTSGDGLNVMTYRITVTRLPETFAFPAPNSVPLAGAGFIASGNAPPFTLGHAPQIGASLRVIDNTGGEAIRGRFDNLAQGQRVEIEFGGILYPFIADYRGGSGNDLVLEWGNTRLLSWGSNTSGQSGTGIASSTPLMLPTPVESGGILAGKTVRSLSPGYNFLLALCYDDTLAFWGESQYFQSGQGPVPVAVPHTGALAGKTVVATAAGTSHTLALCSDGTLAAWGSNYGGPLGNGNTTDSSTPVAVLTTGVLAGKTVTAIAAGSNLSLALCQDGTLAAWGNNASGQLGIGTTTPSFSSSPVAVTMTGVLAGKRPIAIAAGSEFALALCEDGTLAGWGTNNDGQLGDNSTSQRSAPVLVNRAGVLAGKTILGLSTGSAHVLARLSDGTLAAWGENLYGSLGDGSNTDRLVPVLVNRSGVLSGKQIIDAAAGNSHSLAICADGTMAAWGYNLTGQLGDNSTVNRSLPVLVNPSTLKPGERFIRGGRLTRTGSSHAIVASPPAPSSTTLAALPVTDSGAVLNASVRPNGSSAEVWFEFGITPQLGTILPATPSPLDGTGIKTATRTMADLTPGSTYYYRAVSSGPGGIHRGETLSFTTTTLATLANLTASIGQLGPDFEPTTTRYWLSVPAATSSVTFTPVVANAGATVIIGGIPVVSGQPGPPRPVAAANTTIPIVVTSPDGVTLTYQVVITRLPSSFAFTSAADVAVTADGLEASGPLALSLGFVPPVGTNLTVVENTGNGFILGSFDQLSQGQTVTLEHAGIGYPFVANYFGGTGNDLVLQWANIKVLGWGRNESGQVGNANEPSFSPATVKDPRGVLVGKTVTALAAGASHTLALCADGTLAAWGSNAFGQLGDGAIASSPTPVAVDQTGDLAGKTVVAVAAGESHSLVLCSDGTLVAWGGNELWQLGAFDSRLSRTPVLLGNPGVLAGRKVIAIAANGYHSLALCEDGTLAGWGSNSSGQLGDGSSQDRIVPVRIGEGSILGGRKITSMAAGYYHSVALCEDGSLLAWGRNTQGQLGDGSFTNRLKPVLVQTTGGLSGKRVASLSAGSAFSLALCTDGTIAAWGANSGGQLGNAANTTTPLAVEVSRAGVLAGKNVVSVKAALESAVARCSDGTLAAWGVANHGMLGDGRTNGAHTNIPVLVSKTNLLATDRYTGLAAGAYHGLALAASPPLPGATTLPAIVAGDHSATLHASVQANGSDAAVSFDYGTTAAYGNSVTADPATVAAGSVASANAVLSGLQGGTTYHYRAVANGAGGVSYGEDRTFTTRNDAGLVTLALGAAALSPSFASGVTDYVAAVPATTSRVTLTAQAVLPSATIAVNGAAPATGSASVPVDLVSGNNTLDVQVSSADGSATRTYRITIVRFPGSITYRDGSERPMTMDRFIGTPPAPALALEFAPVPGTSLFVLEQTGLLPFAGHFENLAPGQIVELSHGGITYRFVANYHGGDGNDLVLEWANRRIVGWGRNSDGNIGNPVPSDSLLPTAITTDDLPEGWTALQVESSGTGSHTLALGADGTVWSWGANHAGQLGIGSASNSARPVPVDRSGPLAGKRVIRIATGSNHCLALCQDGTLVSWGENTYGQLGIGTFPNRSTPVAVNQTGLLAGKTIIAISAGSQSSFAACSDGTVASWGLDGSGMLGNGAVSSTPYFSLPQAVDRSGVLLGKIVVALEAGTEHCYAICSDGTLVAWGTNTYGELGNNSFGASQSPVLVSTAGVLAGKKVIRVSAGRAHGIALCDDGTVAAWGRNNYGEIGNGSFTQSRVPVAISASGALAGKMVTSVNASIFNSLAICSDGTAAAWGYNSSGQLGNNSKIDSQLPVLVQPGAVLAGERLIAGTGGTSFHHALVASPPAPLAETLAATSVADTGAALNGRAGANGSTTALSFEYGLTEAYGSAVSSAPASVTGSSQTAVSATLAGLLPGTNYHYRLVARSAGGVAYGQGLAFTTSRLSALDGLALSHGTLFPDFALNRTSYSVTVPFSVSSITLTAVAATPGASVTFNGNAANTVPLVPGANSVAVVVQAPGSQPLTYLVAVNRLPESIAFATPSAIGATAHHFDLAGSGVAFSLGHAPVAGASLIALQNTGIEPIRGRFSNLAQGQPIALEHGSIRYEFFANYYGGDGNDLVLQWAHTRLAGWGNNDVGQLGDQVEASVSLLSDLQLAAAFGGSPIMAAATGYRHSLVLTADGRILAWGADNSGELGQPGKASSPVPLPVDRSGILADRTVVDLAAGQSHSLALCDDGRIAAWGWNGAGQLGTAGIADRDVPGWVDFSGVLAGKRVARIAAGSAHNLALCTDGTLVAWGANNGGQLGNSGSADAPAPVRVDTTGVLAGKQVVALAAGNQHSLVLCSDGTLAAWGMNNLGQLGIGSTDSPKRVPVLVTTTGALAGKTATGIACGDDFCLVWCSDGSAVSWGSNNSAGSLGDGTTTSRTSPVAVNGSGVLAGKAITALTAGALHSLALTTDGTAAAWGYNAERQLGTQGTTASSVPAAIHTAGLAPGERFATLLSGRTARHSLALIARPPAPLSVTLAADGITGSAATLRGLVRPNGGSCGIAFEYGLTAAFGTRLDAVPATASGVLPVEASVRIEGLISGATYHFRVLTTSALGTFAGDSRTFTAGDDAALAALSLSRGIFDQPFAAGLLDYRATLPFSASAVNVTAIPANAGSAVTINGGAAAPVAVPVGESTILIEVAAAAGSARQSYRVRLSRLPEIFRFTAAGAPPVRAGHFDPSGMTADFELGYPPQAGTRLVVVANDGTGLVQSRFANLAQGQVVTLASGGRSYRFAANYFGGDGNDLVLEWANTRLFGWGYGATPKSPVPVPADLSGLIPESPIVAVAGGQSHRLVLRADGSLDAWGDNSYGQLGDGSLIASTIPVAVDRSGVLSGKHIIRVAAGEVHSLALCSDGTVAGWGSNSNGVIGPASASRQTVPVAIPVQALAPGKAITGIAVADRNSYAWFEDGTVVAWGANQYGQLGNNGRFESATPVRVVTTGALAGKRVVSVVAGDTHVMALCSDGTLVGWGHNTNGQLGTGNIADSRVPLPVVTTGVLAGKSVIQVAAGVFSTLALCSDGTVAGWGSNTSGALGTAAPLTGGSSWVPVPTDRTGVLAGKTVIEIAAGDFHGSALCSDGTLASWGRNIDGQLGDNATATRVVPVLTNSGSLLPGERFNHLASSPLSASSYAVTALPEAPQLTALDASAIQNITATLRGEISPDGVEGQLHFDYGPDQDYGCTLGATPSSVAGTAIIPASAQVTGLPPGSTWHFRLRLVTGHGTYFSSDRTFTTASDATLASLGSSAGEVSPAFNPTATRYALSVPFERSSLSLIPVPAVAGATVTVNGAPATVPLSLQPGANDLIVEVTSPGPGGTFRYLVVVTRLPEVLHFDNPSLAPLTAREFAAGGLLPPLALNFTPASGTLLTLVNNTGGNPIHGRFSNLPHAGTVDLDHGGTTYRFIANYHGGDGNDLVLQWANTRLFGWGDNFNGEIGNGYLDFSTTPTLAGIGGAMTGKQVLSTSMGDYYSLALATDGSLVSWGEGSNGALGNGTITQSTAPVAVTSSGALVGKSVVAITAGRLFNVAPCDDGTLVAWGKNTSGQLGDGTRDFSSAPLAVPSHGALAGRLVTAVATGEEFVLARCNDGGLVTWGANGSGQLGNNSKISRDQPVTVDSYGALAGKHVSAIAAGRNHSLVLCEDGSLVSWGRNDLGQLGDGTLTERLAPVAVNGGALADKRVIAIAAGGDHSLALCSDGTLVAWGENANGQLGNNSVLKSPLPVAVERTGILAGKSVVAVSAGAAHSLAACSDGTIVSWGANDRGQAGDGTTVHRLAPVAVSTATLRTGERFMNSLPVRHAGRHTLLLTGAPLASATTLPASQITGTRATLHGTVQANRNAVAVSFEFGLEASYGESVAALPPSATGVGTTSASAGISGLRPETTYHFRIVAEGLGGIVRGADQTFTTLSDNALLASLSVSEGVLGPDFDPLGSSYHVSVPASAGSVTVVPATDHPRATFEVLGTHSATVVLTGQRTAIDITVTAEDGETTRSYSILVTRLPETFMLGTDGAAPLVVDGLSARGYPARLSLGQAPLPGSILKVVENTGLSFIHGTFSNLARGQRVTLVYNGLEYDFVANYHGGDGNDLVLHWAATRTFAWGLNSHGQLGDGTTTRRLAASAIQETGVLAGKTVLTVSGGYLHSLALCADGTVAAWGSSAQGQLGNGSTATRTSPIAVDLSDAGGEVIALSAGQFHNLALRADGRIVAWGYNNHGQLGTGDKVTYLRPVLIPAAGALAGKQVVAVAAGTYQSFALCSDGTVAAWGYNDEGELGDGTPRSTAVPVAVDRSGVLAGKSVAAIAVGQYHTLARCTDGTLVSWGYNVRGQLGSGNLTDAHSPVAVDVSGVLASKTVTGLTAGESHSVARCSDGTLAAWGYNHRSQLGNGGTLASPVPVTVEPPGKAAASVAAGRNHNVLLFTDGTLGAWGENQHGQLGNLTTTTAVRPVPTDLSVPPPGSRAMLHAVGPAAYHGLVVVGIPAARPATSNPALLASAMPDDADTDFDGIPDVIELAFGLDRHADSSGQLPQPVQAGGQVGFSFPAPAGVAGFIYGAEWSDSLESGSWRQIPDTGTDGTHEFKMPGSSAPRLFMRLNVVPTSP